MIIDGQMFERALQELREQRARERAAAIEAGTVVDLQARRVEIERRRGRVSPVEMIENERKQETLREAAEGN